MTHGGTGSTDVLVKVSLLPDGDAEELSDLVALLREDLLRLDVLAADPMLESEAPDASKGALAAIGGWLVVTLGPASLRSVVQRAVSWATQNNSSVEISLGGDVLKVTGIDQEQQKRLIDEWLARQSASA